MPSSPQLSVNQIVFAKIQGYPWWPGRIVKQQKQYNEPVFKVNFFADPTFCYLHTQSIIPFEAFQDHLNTSYSFDSKLQKAVSKAQLAFQNKNYEPKCCFLSQLSQNTLNSKLFPNHSKIEAEVSNIFNAQQKTQLFELPDPIPQTDSSPLFPTQQITQANVIQLLQSRLGSLLNEDSPQPSRQKHLLEKKLKQQLLMKYGLNQQNKKIGLKQNKHKLVIRNHYKVELNQKGVLSHKGALKTKIVRKKRQVRHISHRIEQRILCMHKIQRILSFKHISREVARAKAIEYICSIERLSEGNKWVFRKLVVELSRWLQSDIDELMGDQELEWINTVLLNNLVADTKKEDEEKSKVTKVSQ